MSQPTTVDDLIERWEASRERGESLTVDELCRAHPEYSETIRKKIAALVAFDSFLHVDTVPEANWPTPAMPTSINGYEIFSVLGRGGMGVVYKAKQPGLGRIVALKMILAAEHAGEELRQRFRREAEAAARLRHPGIVQIFEVGVSPSGDYLAMEYIEGGSLAERLDGTPWKAPDAARMVIELALAMQTAHEAGIVHRDLKPANVLLSEPLPRPLPETGRGENPTVLSPSPLRGGVGEGSSGVAKITDFGIAKRLDEAAGATQSGAVVGTPSYMAPEQATGNLKAIGPATDVYALGAILYELLTGRPPFRADTAIDTIRQVIDDEPVPPARLNSKIPRDLQIIGLKCLRKDPRRRYLSARELADDLQRFLDGKPILARPVGTLERTIKWAKRRPTAAALIGVSFLALTSLIVGGVWYNSRLSDSLEREKKTSSDLKKELERSTLLANEGDQLSDWLLNEHLTRIASLRGGSTVQKLLVERLLGYLDNVEKEILDHPTIDGETTLIRIIVAYERLADTLGNPNIFNLGQYQAALATYDKAQSLRARLLEKKPEHNDLRIGLARALRKKGEVLILLGKDSDAKKAFEDSLARINALIAENATNELKSLALQSRTCLADLLVATKPDEGLQLYRDILRETIALEGEQPRGSDQINQTVYLRQQIGLQLQAKGDLAGAREQYQKAYGLFRDQQKLTDNARVQNAISKILVALADVASAEKGKGTEALSFYEAALKIRRAQHRADVDNPRAGHELAIVLERIALIKFRAKQFADALPLLNEAMEIRLRLKEHDSGNVEMRRALIILHGQLGDLLVELKRPDDAEKELREQMKGAQALFHQSKNVQDLQGVAEAHFSLAATEYKRASLAATKDEYIRCLEKTRDEGRLSVEAFDQMAKTNPLNPDQTKQRAKSVAVVQEMERVLAQITKGKN